MEQPTTIKIDNIEYVRADTIRPTVDPNSPIKIVILQRGWVMVGRWSRNGDDCTLDDASVIERWGTTKGIGELVSGPTKTTQLRYAGHVEFHVLGVIAAITCQADKWGLK